MGNPGNGGGCGAWVAAVGVLAVTCTAIIVLLTYDAGGYNPLAFTEAAHHESTDAVHRDILFDEIVPPHGATPTVKCRAFKVAGDQSYKSIVAIEPRIDTQYVHRLQLHWCRKDYSQRFEGGAKECGRTPPSYDVNAGCGHTFVWVPGVGRVNFPPGTGLPVGDGGPDELKVAVLEIHYTPNPERTAGIRDRSGFRLFYSRAPVQHTVGMLSIGNPFAVPDARLTIPAGKSRYNESFSSVEDFLQRSP